MIDEEPRDAIGGGAGSFNSDEGHVSKGKERDDCQDESDAS